jgi:hypothetical protein
MLLRPGSLMDDGSLIHPSEWFIEYSKQQKKKAETEEE